ncbi:MAG: peroxiredoxin [Verrucomicrobiales bacterium]|jgi:alkyl hydroperoxide reductase subunit AhpC|nr:peroxiredoxin [Verrucomicrobiales bacterium]|tara:strand:- start:339 stop:974 length:636 start_codon:yes stop_codon:yes gene_type:complete
MSDELGCELCGDLPVLSVGEEVPDFEMETFEPSTGSFGEVSLANLKADGKWTILVFYPADFTFVCPTELADLAAQDAKLTELGAKVIGVSTDTKFAHLAWCREEKLMTDVKYTLAADTTGVVSSLFGVYDDATGLALRGTFIISPEGKLVSGTVNFYNVGRNMEELTRVMEANAHCAANPTEACPAQWTPGDKTLTPNEGMVGNVYEALNG